MHVNVKEPWWIIHRKRQLQSTNYLTAEIIIRKSFKEAFKEYTTSCSIAGVKQMCDPNIGWRLRLLWIAVLCAMFSTVCYFLRTIWLDTLTKPLIVSSESSTYHISEIDFPAVAICNVNRISKKALRDAALRMYPVLARQNQSLKEVETFCLQFGRLLDYTYNASLRNQPFLDLIATHFFDTYRNHALPEFMKELAPSCDEMLVKCAWAGEIVDCKSIFSMRRTVRGHCCAFNYVLDYDSADMPNATIGIAKRQVVPGVLHGLNVILDPLLDDYAYPLANIQGFDVLMFDPTHFADLNAGRVIHRIAEPNKKEVMELKSIKQVASPEVRKYPLSTRQCLFHDEPNIKFGRMYSYSACIVNCRKKTVQSLCKCTPYFLPTLRSMLPICTLEDLICLNKYKEKFLYLFPLNAIDKQGLEMEIVDSLYCPHCLPDCELTQHFSKSYSISLFIDSASSDKVFKNDFRGDINMSNKCYLSIYHPTSDGILDRLDVVSYWFEILSNIGGFGGVIMGFSVFSAVEIIYFMFVRFFQILHSNYRKYYY